MRTQVLFNRAPIEAVHSFTNGHEYLIPCWDNCAGGAHLVAQRPRETVPNLPGLLREVYYNFAVGIPWLFHIPLP